MSDRFYTALKAIPEDKLLEATRALRQFFGKKTDITSHRLLKALDLYLEGEMSSYALACWPDMCDLSTDDTKYDTVGCILACLIFPWLGGYNCESVAGDPYDPFWSVRNDPLGTVQDKYAEEWAAKTAEFLENWQPRGR